MSLKKLLLSSLIIICGTISTSYSMREVQLIQASDDFVTGATFYTIHGFKEAGEDTDREAPITFFQTKNCITSGKFECMSKKTDQWKCPGHDLIDHDEDQLMVTYYDNNWSPLAVVDLTDLKFQASVPEGSVVRPYGAEITNFDKTEYQQLRSQELKELHNYCRKHLDPLAKPKAKYANIFQSYITFYGFADEVIAKFEYNGGLPLKREYFKPYLDLSELAYIRKESMCILF